VFRFLYAAATGPTGIALQGLRRLLEQGSPPRSSSTPWPGTSAR